MSPLVFVAQEPRYPHWYDHWQQWLVIGIILAAGVFIGFVNYQNRRPFRMEATTTASVDATLDQLQARFARDGWSLGYRDAGTRIMSADRNAYFFGTAAIGCLSVWLALVHLLSAKKTVTVEITASEHTDGAVVIVNGNKTGDGVAMFVSKRLRELPKAW